MIEPVYFLSLKLENIRCFGKDATLDLSDGNGNWRKWTVILGNNGTGKTTLLQLLATLEANDGEQYNPEIVKNANELQYIPQLGSIRIPNRLSFFSKLNGKECKVEYSLIREYQKHTFDISIRENFTTFNLMPFGFNVYGYGANRIMDTHVQNKASFNSQNSETLLSDTGRLINASEWLLQLDYSASKESDIQEFVKKRRNQVIGVLIDLLPDIDDIRFTSPTKENLITTVEFKTPFGWTELNELSLGYKSMVAWLVDLAARLFEQFPDSPNPLTEPAIVLVDEIDLHLHPKWQRKIFDYLSDRFPKTQFIVTAHSPLVVQSAPQDANIILLRKVDDHVVIDNDIQSIRNWRLDQIMSSDLFGIESSRGPEIEKWLEERKELLQKNQLTEVEQLRLNELNQLAQNLPTAETLKDIEAMEIIRKAANFLKEND